MTALAAAPVIDGQLDLLSTLAESTTPLGALHADDFRRACFTDAAFHEGWVNPNRVSAALHAQFGEIKPQWFSAMWSASRSPSGFLDKTDVEVPIDPKHSRGNGNKAVKMRRLRGAR